MATQVKTREQIWTINYLPGEGVRLTGKLILDDEHVRFRALYDSSFKTIAKQAGLLVGSMVGTGGHLAVISEKGSNAEIVLPRSAIENVRAARRGLMKQVVITLSDEQEFVFEYGLLSVKKIIAAIA